MKHHLIPLLGLLFILSQARSQDSLDTAVAASGDGIFSLLRKQGLDPTKYYVEFLEINAQNIVNGSELKVGKRYLIPDAPDSFKNMGRLVKIPEHTDAPIFDSELAKFNLKSDKLKNAVYYLIAENGGNDNKFTKDITLNLAKELLVNGARVYVIERSKKVSEPDLSKIDEEAKSGDEGNQMMADAQNYVEAINKRYLRHSRKYQRLLVVRSSGNTTSRNLDVSIFHHEKSEAGQKFAENIQSVFREKSIKRRSFENYADIFHDKNNLFLAKNTLAPITVVEIGDFKSNQNERKISVRSDKKALAEWLSSGLFKDYADLEIEE